MLQNSAELVQKASCGEQAAVAELLERHLPWLQAYVRLRMGGVLRAREDSMDVVQSVCGEILAHLERYQYQGEGNFRRWLAATALRTLANRQQHQQAHKRDVRREQRGCDADEVLLAGCSSFFTPSRAAAAAEQAGLLEQAFARLPEEEQELILLAKVMELPRAEIAAQLGKSETAVRSTLSRALARLGALLAPA